MSAAPKKKADKTQKDMSGNTASDFLLYQTEDGKTRVEVRIEGETVWLSQAQMAELFQRERSVIAKHILNVFAERELDENSVCAKYAQTAGDGKTYQTTYYNLDVIISVGYRVKSHRGTQFRIWATQRLREFIVKGFALETRRRTSVWIFSRWRKTKFTGPYTGTRLPSLLPSGLTQPSPTWG